MDGSESNSSIILMTLQWLCPFGAREGVRWMWTLGFPCVANVEVTVSSFELLSEKSLSPFRMSMPMEERYTMCQSAGNETHYCFVSTSGLSEDAARIRREVFMDEQGFEVEFDDLDMVSTHIVLYENGVPVAVCRLYMDGGDCHIGRVAVVADHRGRSLGRMVIAEAERVAVGMGASRTVLGAQVCAKGFYESCGYSAYGDVFMDERCPHVMMGKPVQRDL